jgi:hypothetical protein
MVDLSCLFEDPSFDERARPVIYAVHKPRKINVLLH